ncbi:MAG TPA: TonB-dependent receptor plug domain-containing protein, partial [Longimicrobium sp.]|nr:TonB-dependent receptor plug domain-containing protein [Longimicrobium sp.]
MRIARPVLTLAAAAACTALHLLALPGRTAAQQPAGPAAAEYVAVHVTDASSGTAVADAEVWVGGTRTRTDAGGRALLPLRQARETLMVRRIGYGDQLRELALGAATLEVALQPEPVAMSGVEATGRRPPMSPPLQRFYQRLDRGHGSFVTREQIDRRKPRRLTDLFREIPGVRVANTSRGDRLVMTGATPAMYRVGPGWEAGDCPVQYYLDGVSYQPDIAGVPNDVRPDEVEGIEVYRRLSEVPVEYR